MKRALATMLRWKKRIWLVAWRQYVKEAERTKFIVGVAHDFLDMRSKQVCLSKWIRLYRSWISDSRAVNEFELEIDQACRCVHGLGFDL